MQPVDPERADERRRNLQFRFASLGLEFGAGIVGCVLAGYWVDRTFGTANKGVIVGALVGCVGGMYHLVTQAIRLQQRFGSLGAAGKSEIKKDDSADGPDSSTGS